MSDQRREVLQIAISMTVMCAIGAAILGAVFVGTERYRREATIRGEHEAVASLLSLDSTSSVLEVRQYLAPERRQVIYRRAASTLQEESVELVFTFDGELVSRSRISPDAAEDERGLESLGRVFVATQQGQPAGFVIEGEARGYKNRIRFFVALDPEFDIAGVHVVEHEEDPGLGAEVATGWFQGQYIGRTPEEIAVLDVTRDPMPEDWRAALSQVDRMPAAAWLEAFGDLRRRERQRPVYAVSGATISSRALTDGVRTTVEHFRRRWDLIAPHLGGEA